MKEIIKGGILTLVFTKAGVALPVILALTAYIGLRSKNVSLRPLPATL
ncbi:hypothetical protein [Halorussus amylolyticus]|nr:hypothetical protein [Halorussus amylolyticus]